MRTDWRVPGWHWQVVIAGVFVVSCRFIEEDDPAVHDRAQVLSGDTARYAHRDAGVRTRDDHPDDEHCDDPRRCGPRAGTKAGGNGGAGGSRHDGGAGGSAGSRHGVGAPGGSAGSRQAGGAGAPSCPAEAPDASQPTQPGSCSCDDAGVAPATGDRTCPESAVFESSCTGALHCGPYDGPLHASCSWTCCGKPVSYTVPQRTIAECIHGRWAFSIDPDAPTDACSAPHACTCTGE